MRELADFLASQKPSPIFTESMIGHHVGELLPGGTIQKHFIHDTAVVFEHAGVRLRVGIYDNNTGRDCIHLQWEDIGRRCQEVAMVPHSFQYAKLLAKENMR